MAEGTLRDVLSQVLSRMDRQDHALEEIRAQVTRTNGRVTYLEKAEAISIALEQREQIERRQAEEARLNRAKDHFTLKAAAAGSSTSVVLLAIGHHFHLL